jgi:MGT family glycosyltransferase
MTLRSASVVLVTWDGAGNLPPQRALVRALTAAGHTVRVLGHDSVREAFGRDGAAHLPVPGLRPYDALTPIPPEEEMPFVVEHIWYARAFGAELLATIDRLGPDLVLVDICLTYALVAALRSGVPTVVLGHFPYSLLLGPFAPLTAARLEETNAYATELGLVPFASHQMLIESAPVVLVPTYRPFETIGAFAPNVAHIGPCRSDEARTEPWPRRLPDRPLVLVGLSTSQQHQTPLLQRLCDALADLDIEGLVTTGPAIAPESLRASDNTTVTSFVPHGHVLPSAGLLITHAGHGTVMAGVTHGVPMLCFPMGRDQPLIAGRVADLGLGSVASPDASVADIREAIAALLHDAGVKQRSKDLARSLADHPGLDHGVGMVEGLLHA